MTRNVTDYHEYLQSREWQAKRQWALKWADYRCQICNSPADINVHHRTYDNVGYELPGDLTVLCEAHHEMYHNSIPRRPPIDLPPKPPPAPPDPLSRKIQKLRRKLEAEPNEQRQRDLLVQIWKLVERRRGAA